MASGYRDTVKEITRLQQAPPPLLPMPFMLDTMVTRAWVNDPIHDEVAPMEHHVIAPTLRGNGWSQVRFGSQSIRSPSITGRITIAPRGFSGRFDCDGTPIASNIFLSRERLERAAENMGLSRPPELMPRLNAEDPKLFAILSLIGAEAADSGPHGRLYLETLLELLCVQLLRAHAVFPGTNAQSKGGLSRSQVRLITDHMKQHLDEPIGLQELANLVGLSRFHLCTAFRRATGKTPHQWLVGLRINEARRLLQDRRLSVTEIALAVGYQTPSSFAQAFRLAVGVTPSEFRRAES